LHAAFVYSACGQYLLPAQLQLARDLLSR